MLFVFRLGMSIRPPENQLSHYQFTTIIPNLHFGTQLCHGILGDIHLSAMYGNWKPPIGYREFVHTGMVR
jgi:hypothetical protein